MEDEEKFEHEGMAEDEGGFEFEFIDPQEYVIWREVVVYRPLCEDAIGL